MKEVFANYLQKFKDNNPELAIQLYYIINIFHYFILLPSAVVIIIFTNNLLLLIAFIIIWVLVIWHWEIYGECFFTTFERTFGGDTYIQVNNNFKNTCGPIAYWCVNYSIPIIAILIALYKIYYLKTTCKRR